MNPLRRQILAMAVGLAAAPAFAQPYPARPIRFVVPFPAGGGTDVVARALGEKLSTRLGQPIIVDNKPGAGTTIGMEATAKSAPDGYTFLLGSISGHAIVSQTYTKLSFDIRRDLAPVTRIGYGAMALVVPQSMRANSVKELIALAKTNPGKLTFASSGTGGLIHLTGELFKHAAGVDMVHVPYKGTTQIIPDILAGRIDMALDSLPAYVPHLESGKLRALAVSSRQRSALLPNLPTMAEVGLPGVVSSADYALYAPVGTPKEVIALVNREMHAVLQMPDIRTKLGLLGIELAASTPEALQAELHDEFAKWGKLIREANIKLE